MINENDTVATSEIKYGDNDRLEQELREWFQQMFIILSNVDGLFDTNPSDINAKLIKNVKIIDDKIISMAEGANKLGRGGMITKLEAAKIATQSGCHMIISSGRIENPILSALDGAQGTFFHSSTKSLTALKSWISGSIKPTGSINIDTGANSALKDGKSLLPAGIISIEGKFEKGDTLIVKAQEKEVARGLTNFNSIDLVKIIGKKSEEIEDILGYLDKMEVIHRNNLYYSGNEDEQ